MSVCMRVYACLYIHIHTHYIHIYIHTHTHTNTHMDVRSYVCVCIYIHTCIYAYTHTCITHLFHGAQMQKEGTVAREIAAIAEGKPALSLLLLLRLPRPLPHRLRLRLSLSLISWQSRIPYFFHAMSATVERSQLPCVPARMHARVCNC